MAKRYTWSWNLWIAVAKERGGKHWALTLCEVSQLEQHLYDLFNINERKVWHKLHYTVYINISGWNGIISPSQNVMRELQHSTKLSLRKNWRQRETIDKPLEMDFCQVLSISLNMLENSSLFICTFYTKCSLTLSVKCLFQSFLYIVLGWIIARSLYKQLFWRAVDNLEHLSTIFLRYEVA